MKYRHYKGDIYQVAGTARHSETQELLVIYHNIDEPHLWWARPNSMFHGYTDDGQKRFTLIMEDDA